MGLIRQKILQLADNCKPNIERNCDVLAAVLEEGEVADRRQAAREIVRCLDAARTLVSRLKREEDLSVREVILNTLLRLNDPSAFSELADCLRSEDAALRNEVIEGFKQIGSEVDPVLHALLTDADPDVRIFVVNILNSQRHPEVESWLIKVIEQDCNVNVCATAVDLLCEVATEASVDPLIGLKARFASEPYIQFAADLALKRIREA